MADNAPEPPKKAQPPLPTSGLTARVPTTKLPGQASKTGKVVVMLSSTSKMTPLPPVSSGAVPKVAPPLLPAKRMPVATPLPAEQRLASTTFVKLPPKTSAPAFVSLVPQPKIVPAQTEAAKTEPPKVAPPLLPPKRVDPATPPELPKPDARKTGPIVLNTPGAPAPLPAPAKADNKKTGLIKLNTPAPAKADDSIFAEIPAPAAPPIPEGWKRLETGELPQPSGGLKDTDPFEHSRRLDPKPAPAMPVPVAKPPPLPAAITAKAEPTLNPAPVALPPAHPVQHAPPLLEKGHDKSNDEAAEKLPPPHLPESSGDSLKMPVVGPIPQAPEMPKAPELKMDAPAPAKPSLPPEAKSSNDTRDKAAKSAPYMLTSTARIPIPGAGEARPALRPAVLPSRAVRTLAESPALNPPPSTETTPATAKAPSKPEEISAKDGPATPAPVPAPQVEPEAKPAPAAKEPEAEVESVAKVEPAAKPEPPKPTAEPVKDAAHTPPPLAAAAVAAGTAATAAGTSITVADLAEKKSKKPSLPPTRTERARKRKSRGVVAFWIFCPLVAIALYFGILYFGRDTRAEGQVIPPPGMSLADEVWIVSDFSTLAAGVADDVARERVPLQLAIQEAQDHVQRVQADIASREERIHLIQDDIQSAKDEITSAVKKAQTDSQAIYDGQGKQLDDEYNNKMASLKQAIADRAASLKLQYAPDPAFPSPEVWANAYRLALYETPPGVDGVKEHQWIADQMKAWRDFEKSMDAQYDQMREQAATLKQEAAPKITDLNAKIDDLNGRIQATQAEEEPLKAELKQAQSDLASAQAAEAGLDDKYYGQLDALPAENVSYHIPITSKGRFTWIPDNPFGEGEIEHNYIIFARAIRADGRQYWSLHEFTMRKDEVSEITLEPGSFESTKQILRPNLSPDEVEE